MVASSDERRMSHICVWLTLVYLCKLNAPGIYETLRNALGIVYKIKYALDCLTFVCPEPLFVP